MASSLGLVNFIMVEESPDRNNIRYAVINSNLKENDKDVHFGWLAHELDEKKGSTEKVLIFCKTHRNSRNLHATLTENLSDEDANLVALFSSVTEETRKKELLTDFTKSNGKIRVLLATSAFGMGINVRGLHYVIGYGSSRDIDDYFQESGRVGRDGVQSHALLLNYKGNFGKGKTDEGMRNYANTTDKCRRDILLAHYQHSATQQPMLHNCCDTCSSSCMCGGEQCVAENNGMSDMEMKLRSAEGPGENSKHLYRVANDEVRDIIKDQLLLFRDSLLTAEVDKLYTGKDIACGFPMSLINEIVENYEFIGSEDQLKTFPFFSMQHVSKVWTILEELGGEVAVECESLAVQSADFDSETSDNENEYYGAITLSDFDEDDFEEHHNYISSQCPRIYLSDSYDD